MKEKEINEPNSTDMNRKGIVTAFLLAAGLLAGREAQAQRTYEEMEQLTVNERVTMVVTVSEPVRPADISTDKESLPRERKGAEPQKQGSRMGQTDSVRPLVGAIQENHEAGQPHHPVRTRDVHRRTDPLATRLVEIQPRVDERPCKRALERQPYAAASA